MPDIPTQQRLAAWFSRWRQPLRRWLGSRGRIPAADLDDLAQDVFLRLIHYDRAKVVEAPQAYLFRVAANVANEWAMLARNRQPHEAKWLEDLWTDDQPALDTLREQSRTQIAQAIRELALFPHDCIAIVSFTNFGYPTLARLINEHIFDHLMELKPVRTLEAKLSQYEERIDTANHRCAGVPRIDNTSPSHALPDYSGIYEHPGYGPIEIRSTSDGLTCVRDTLILPLEHWHYDSWVARDIGIFCIHDAHAFDRASRISFHTDADGEISAVSIPLEPAVAPIVFQKLTQHR